MDSTRQQAIIKVCRSQPWLAIDRILGQVFFTKYKNTLGPQVISFVEDLLDRHGIEDEDIASSVEHLAREYNRQDGAPVLWMSLGMIIKLVPDAEMVVQMGVLQRVYETMQASQTMRGPDLVDDQLDTDSQLFFIDAFEMPKWHWSPERNTFEKCMKMIPPLVTAPDSFFQGVS